MSELVVPKHIADEDRKAAQQKVDEAYIKAEDRVLDPTLLNKSLLDRMPTPTGWRLLVLPYRGKGVTEGGIHLTDSTLDRESLATVVAYVLKVGPTAYKDEENFGQQFPTDTGPIDILAISKDKKEVLVVELKKGRASDAVVGQIQRYMGYITEFIAEDNQQVKGIIIALDEDQRIKFALKVAPNIDFYRYEVKFNLIKE